MDQDLTKSVEASVRLGPTLDVQNAERRFEKRSALYRDQDMRRRFCSISEVNDWDGEWAVDLISRVVARNEQATITDERSEKRRGGECIRK